MNHKILNKVMTEEKARLDVAVASSVDISRSQAEKLIEQGRVSVDGVIVTKSSKQVVKGQLLEVRVPEPEKTDLTPKQIPLDIVFENNDYIVINKQQGLTVHPGGGNNTDTLVNALLYYETELSGINGDLRPGIVHRLDKDTSGLMLVAKNDRAHRILASQIADKTCKRIYVALLEGVVKNDSGTVDMPLGRSTQDRKKIAIVQNGRKAVTDYKVLKRYEKNTLVEFSLRTGRTHQIRVHAKYLGHPVVGDKVYGYKNQRFALSGQLLHSRRIEFFDPSDNTKKVFSVPVPDYFLRILKIVNRESK